MACPVPSPLRRRPLHNYLCVEGNPIPALRSGQASSPADWGRGRRTLSKGPHDGCAKVSIKGEGIRGTGGVPITFIDEGVPEWYVGRREAMFKPVVHLGDALKDELDKFGITLTGFARRIDVPPNRISQVIAGKRSGTGDTAWALVWSGAPVLDEPSWAVRPRRRRASDRCRCSPAAYSRVHGLKVQNPAPPNSWSACVAAWAAIGVGMTKEIEGLLERLPTSLHPPSCPLTEHQPGATAVRLHRNIVTMGCRMHRRPFLQLQKASRSPVSATGTTQLPAETAPPNHPRIRPNPIDTDCGAWI